MQNQEIGREKFLLGWFLWQPSAKETKRQLSSGKNFRIVELKDGECLYCIGLPELSAQETGLLSGAFEEYKAMSSPEFQELENIELFLEDYCERKLAVLEQDQKEYLGKYLRLMAFGHGPLSVLLENQELEEIAANGTGPEKPVRVFDKRMGWLRTNFYYCSESAVKNAVNKMASRLGKRVSLQNPRLNAVLNDGSRLSCSINPVSFLGPSFTLRKFGRLPFSPAELVANNTASAEAMAFLKAAFITDCNAMIAGNTGSGKSSTLNSLLCFVPKDERIIAVEETPELNIMHNHLVKLNVSEGLNISMKDLIVDSLRMRPDRVIVGEVRNEEELLAFVDTILAGQGRGSYCTFHAQSSRDALARMKKLGVIETDLLALDLIVIQRRWKGIGESSEKRRIVEISEIIEKEGRPELNTIFSFDYGKDRLEKAGESARVREKFQNASSSGSKTKFREFLMFESARMQRLAEKNSGILEFFRLEAGKK